MPQRGTMGTLAAEAQSVTPVSFNPSGAYTATGFYSTHSIAGGGDVDPYATKTDTFSAISHVVAGIGGILGGGGGTTLKIRIFIAGVQVAESAFIAASFAYISITGHKATDGSKVVKATIHNYDAGNVDLFSPCNSADDLKYYMALSVGCVKV